MSDAIGLLSRFELKIDGSPTPDTMQIAELIVENSLHLPDVATIEIFDQELKWIDDKSLDPGRALVITAGYEGAALSTIFDGEIIEIEPIFSDGTQRLIVRAFDRLHRLSRGRYVRTFLNVKDSDIVQKIAGEVGLQAQATPTSEVHPYVMQSGQTNLEFLQGRAAALGYMLYVEGKKLHFGPPKPSAAPIRLEMLDDLFEFRPRMSTIGQVSSVMVRGWDTKTKKAVVGQVKSGTIAPKVGAGTNGGAVAQKAFGLTAEYALSDRPLRTQDGAQRLAQAVADRLGGQFVQAEGLARGNPKLLAGMSLTISGVGKRFGGSYYVTGATHTYDHERGYATGFSVSGLEPITLLNTIAPQPEERTPMPGLAIALVTDNNDPENLGRVKVKYPWLSDEHASDWARVLSIGGGPNRGLMVLPEVNDEVLVGFEMGDINYPYVIGGLWNGKDAPPLKSAEAVKSSKVERRVFRTRVGHEIILDDGDKGGVTITDKNKNQIVLSLDKDTITITCKGNLTLDAGGDLILKAKGKLSVDAGGQGELKSMGMKIDGGTSPTELKGMGVKVEGGAGTVDVKGSVINLN